MVTMIELLLPVLIIVIIIFSQSIKMVNEYERVVIFRLGRLSGVKGPGLFLIIPFIDRALKIDLRVVAIDVPKQAVITRDNVTVEVDAVVYYKVVEPGAAITQVENYMFATSTLSQTTLRDVLGQMELDELLSERENINKQIQELLDAYTDPWGIKVTGVTIRDVSLPETMKRAIAKQAEAEREKRARIILAEGEYQAAEKMKDAAILYQGMPTAIKLRELQTFAEIARERNLIVVTQSQSVETGNIAALSQAVSGKAQPLSGKEE
ncbi:TPA: slipin family protein [Methanosarcina acetivorans]|jgi:regulator of protease activity HflC (stomatin/prohibitin superfamily)|uniref:Erythrocyte band 7 integral membrane protein n=2 Tax=Methanosarcina acetivorans TaxID=2214 RepID=Q8TS88_METAC|nr:slipin family protein [Methanosarcina acetivorans]AAM04349.1 erythrocyte band 7 integral membrane protein [Methanosarcina acetivorans C2A]HIH93529.1 slipin family protein [Methanosarcina acetivorans]